MKVADLFAQYRQSINPPYARKDLISILGTLFTILVIPLIFILANQAREPRSLAQTQDVGPVGKAEESFISNELLLKVKKEAKGKVKEGNPEDTGIASINSLNKENGVQKYEKIAKIGKKSKADAEIFAWYKITLEGKKEKITSKLDKTTGRPDSSNPDARVLQEVIARYKNDPNIETVEPNYVINILATPNDPYFSSTGSWGQAYPDLWGVRKINPEPAWDQTTGSTSIVVADIDTGVDRNHVDIQNNMWVNTAEIPNNGIDEDGNGYIDDYYGWDWYNNDNDPMDDHGHGTHTVGTIAAVGNNGVGVVGVNWTSKIMALKFISAAGYGYEDDAVTAIQYAADMGAKVSSNSWGSVGFSTMLNDAIEYSHNKGMVVVVAAGNSNSEALDFTPASADRAVTVAASDSNDAKASFSNWGEKIDVAAPGVDILSLKAAVSPMCTSSITVGTNYCRVSGTSMATPHVAGLAALLLAKNPTLTNEEIRQIIRNGADDLGATGKDRDFGYGRINAIGSMSLTAPKPLAPIITSPRSRTTAFGTNFQISGSIPGPNFASYKVEVGTGRDPTSWTILATSTTQPTANSVLANVDTTKLAEGKFIFRLTATDTSNKTYQFQVHDVEVDNFDGEITFPLGLVSLSSVDIFGTAQTKNGISFANYKIEWGSGGSPTAWSSSGITLINSGTQPIINGKLATWDTSTLTDGQTYSLRLTISSTIDGVSYQTRSITKADKDLVKGWPKMFVNTVCYCQSSPTLADLDGDGIKEIVIAEPDSKIYVYRKDGTNFPGFPVSIDSNDYFDGGVNVDDLDNDGKKEIVATANNNNLGIRIYVIKSDGKAYPGWPQPSINAYRNTPTIADLDSDGTKELVIMEVKTWTYRTDAYLYAFDLHGTQIKGFPKTLTLPPVGFDPGELYPVSYMGALSIADLDKDGKPEIAWSYSNRMYLFDNQGNILSGWPYIVPDYNGQKMLFYSAAASGDINGDGALELFAGAVKQNCLSCYSQLYGWQKNGSVLSGWPKTDDVTVPWYNTATPSLADVDSDGKDEVMVGYNQLAIFDENGKKALTNSPGMHNQPALGDVDGDGKLEFVGGKYNNLVIARQDGPTFTKYFEKIIPTGSNGLYMHTPAAIADLDNDGKMELALITSPMGVSSTGTLNQVAYLWEIPKTGGAAKYEWPMFSYDSARAGRLVLGSPPVDTQPPQRSNGVPTGQLPSGTTQTTISLTTDEVATCKYTTNVGVTYDSMPNTFSITGGTSHSKLITGLINGGSYNYYVRCLDTAGNPNTDDYPISFSVASIQPSPPTVDIKANGSNGPITVIYNTAATLSWTSSNATSCTASNGWSGTKATSSGSESTGNLASSKTYTLTCTGAGGTASDSIIVNIGKLGDLNLDNLVNIRDASILVSRWGRSDQTADLSRDGIVNIRDASILVSRWGS